MIERPADAKGFPPLIWRRSTMRKSIIIAIMFAGIGMSTPSFADDHGGYCTPAGDHGLKGRIDDDVRNGRVSWREGHDLHAKVDLVRELEGRYCRHGLNGWQARDLDDHYHRVADEIARAENGRRPG
jgi:hypothetical protein